MESCQSQEVAVMVDPQPEPTKHSTFTNTAWDVWDEVVAANPKVDFETMNTQSWLVLTQVAHMLWWTDMSVFPSNTRLHLGMNGVIVRMSDPERGTVFLKEPDQKLAKILFNIVPDMPGIERITCSPKQAILVLFRIREVAATLAHASEW